MEFEWLLLSAPLATPVIVNVDNLAVTSEAVDHSIIIMLISPFKASD